MAFKVLASPRWTAAVGDLLQEDKTREYRTRLRADRNTGECLRQLSFDCSGENMLPFFPSSTCRQPR
jgi:hypothetical protein